MSYLTDRRYVRAKQPLQILRGDYLTEPGKLTSNAPPTDDSAIYEGMVLKKITSGAVNGVAVPVAFDKVAAADSTTTVSFFIARHDGDSRDVIAAGNLTGLDCSDDFEVQSGYFTLGAPLAVDDPLTCGADGVLVVAAAGDTIIGRVTKIGTGTNNAIVYNGLTPSTATAADAEVIQFKTVQSGAVVPTP